MHPLIREINKEQEIEDRHNFKVGDGVRVHVKVKEGGKERIQVFAGIVIALRKGSTPTFTVRRFSNGQGVERIFPLYSPSIEKVEVERESEVMRARMYYMRDRIGKAANAVKQKVFIPQ